MKIVKLTSGEDCFVDDGDFPLLAKFSWMSYRPRRNYYPYAVTRINKTIVSMHRMIMGEPDCQIDHKDGNGLNNQKYNLRECSAGQNRANITKYRSSHGVPCSSKYKGVTFRKDNGLWRARIRKNKELINLGHFNCEIDAAKAYNEAAKNLFGEFARLNVL